MAITLSAKKGLSTDAWSKHDDSVKGTHIFQLW